MIRDKDRRVRSPQTVRAWIELSMEAVAHNLEQFEKHLPIGTKRMAVVKANAYGHGSVEIARAARAAGADALGVAIFDEAAQLRKAGIDAPLLVMGYTPRDAYETAIRENIDITLFHREDLAELSRIAMRLGRSAAIHLKYDTGMGRIGLVDEEELLTLAREADQMPGIGWRGVFTHYACADGDTPADRAYTDYQHRKLQSAICRMREAGLRVPMVHAGNSAAAILHGGRCCEMARIGISLYGMYPSKAAEHQGVRLQPVLALKSRIVGRLDDDRAVVGLGYADGLFKALEGRGFCLVGGVRRPLLQIDEHQSTIMIPDTIELQPIDEVVMIGDQYGASIKIDELAGWMGTINYEILSRLPHHLPRIY